MQLRPAPADHREDGPGRVPHHGGRGARRLRRVPVQDLWHAAARAGRPAPRPRPVRRLGNSYGGRAAPRRPGRRLTSTPLTNTLLTKTSERSSGLQAEQESVPAKRAKELRGSAIGAPPALFRPYVRSCNGEDGVQIPGIPRRDAAAGAVAHVRLRPPRMEPDPRRPARPLAP